jgi:hypothetical protein
MIFETHVVDEGDDLLLAVEALVGADLRQRLSDDVLQSGYRLRGLRRGSVLRRLVGGGQQVVRFLDFRLDVFALLLEFAKVRQFLKLQEIRICF